MGDDGGTVDGNQTIKTVYTSLYHAWRPGPGLAEPGVAEPRSQPRSGQLAPQAKIF